VSKYIIIYVKFLLDVEYQKLLKSANVTRVIQKYTVAEIFEAQCRGDAENARHENAGKENSRNENVITFVLNLY